VSANGRLQRWPIGAVGRASRQVRGRAGGALPRGGRSAPLFRGSERGLPRPCGPFWRAPRRLCGLEKTWGRGGSPRRRPISAYRALVGLARIVVSGENPSALPGAAANLARWRRAGEAGRGMQVGTQPIASPLSRTRDDPPEASVPRPQPATETTRLYKGSPHDLLEIARLAEGPTISAAFTIVRLRKEESTAAVREHFRFKNLLQNRPQRQP
jgi:hypothetical protein